VGHPLRLFEVRRGTAHTLIVYADATTAEDELIGFEKLAAKVRAQDPTLIDVYVVVSADAALPADIDVPVLRDEADAFRDAYGVRGAAAYLIRPDGHVGFRCAPVSAAALDDHLANIFTT
jgi:hypothetical protein